MTELPPDVPDIAKPVIAHEAVDCFGGDEQKGLGPHVNEGWVVDLNLGKGVSDVR